MTYRKYTRELLEEAVKVSTSVAGVLRHLGLRQAGGTQAHIAQKIRDFEIDTTHFTGMAHNKGGIATNRRSYQDLLVLGKETNKRTPRNQLLRAMLEYGFVYVCALDAQEPTWNGQSLLLEIDHINGRFWDNRPENLRFLCPNCHSQQGLTNVPYKYRIIL